MDYTEYRNIAASQSPSSNTPRFGREYTKYVRYSEQTADGPRQLPHLHPLDAPTPEHAEFVSPVYLLTDEQVKSHNEVLRRDKSGGYAVSGYSCIAVQIQEECEDDGNVRYPLLIESDADVSFSVMRQELKRFIQNELDVNPNDCRWYYSGGRSLHVHLPFYVRTTAELERLRRIAEDFNEDSDAPVDPKTFQMKSMARLPSAIHRDTGILKQPIDPTCPDEDLQGTIGQMVAGVAFTIDEESISSTAGSADIVDFGLSDELGLIKEFPTPLIERQEVPSSESELALWKRYNRHPFSPYANTGAERRSIVIAQIKGNPYCRDNENGIDEGIFVPAFIHGAVGADGGYPMWWEDGRLRISKKDYDKWDSQKGDTIVILGGQSRGSRIIKLGACSNLILERDTILGALLSDAEGIDDGYDGRTEAIAMLRDFGYDVGSAGKNGPYRPRKWSERTENLSHAGQLQLQAEQQGVETLSHQDRLDVGNRLLSIHGWDEAVKWFREQYGRDYDKKITYGFLNSIIMKYDDISA